ncbi:class I glutamine amidotransferase-like protein [Flammula alnicola]|nr:class I glutamine amidotransferase-like protein [Flammula alnicola]KAF8958987.1 class I glutamine amidotransferase-like protein [Flammula alnicola]
MPSALVLIADGTEEMEFTITYDTLVRGGVHTVSAYVPDVSSPGLLAQNVSPPSARGSRGINIMPDVYFDLNHCGPDMYDLLVIPGGAKGADTMSKHPSVQEVIRRYVERNKLVGMICAGTLAAKTAKLPKQPLTSHPSVKAQLEHDFEYLEDPVVVSDNLITSRGPGTAFPFALTLVELLCGAERREEIRGHMVFPADTPF